MNHALPYIFFIVLAISLGFMIYYMNDLAKLGNTTSIVPQEIAK
jgi:hypothetical protein